jgi:hypothetical protein
MNFARDGFAFLCGARFAGGFVLDLIRFCSAITRLIKALMGR